MSEIIRRNTCATCAWKVGHGDESYCRRNPPTPVFVATIGQNGKPTEGIIAMFPKVKPDMWCGEYSGIVRHIESAELGGLHPVNPGNGRA
jgi:hypothetical protein